MSLKTPQQLSEVPCFTAKGAKSAKVRSDRLRVLCALRGSTPQSAKEYDAFTLLELVVVLAILAVVTALATRSLSTLEDQRRFEASQRGLDELEAAVIGSDDDRAPDGSRTIGGFVADMGRLPHSVLDPDLAPPQVTLKELWSNLTPNAYDSRQALAALLTDPTDEDRQVFVPGGWRGPYLRLPLGAKNLLDGWGNAYSSLKSLSVDPELARLRDGSDQAITEEGNDIVTIRHLGANGIRDSYDEGGYDQDRKIVFSAAKIHSSLSGIVDVLNSSEDSPSSPAGSVTVRVFAPDPTNPAKIAVYKSDPLAVEAGQVHYIISGGGLLTIGPRIIRAYFTGSDTSYNASAVKTVVLQPGPNSMPDLKIDRVRILGP